MSASVNEERCEALPSMRPAFVCSRLLAALDGAEGRRRTRKRDQTPDVMGLNAKRSLLEAVVRDDPTAGAFTDWLLRYVSDVPEPAHRSTVAAMAHAVHEEWLWAHRLPEFSRWLEGGAYSEDARPRES